MFGPRQEFAGKQYVSPSYEKAVELSASNDGIELTAEVIGPYCCEATGLSPTDWRGLTNTERACWMGYAEGKRLGRSTEVDRGRSSPRHPNQREGPGRNTEHSECGAGAT